VRKNIAIETHNGIFSEVEELSSKLSHDFLSEVLDEKFGVDPSDLPKLSTYKLIEIRNHLNDIMI
jgi:hypothetical protein